MATLLAAMLGLAAGASARDGGAVQWVRSMGGSSPDIAYDVLALADGSVLVTGEFWGQATFGITTLTSLGESDLFVLRLSPFGTVLWAKRGGGPYSDRGLHVRLASDGNVIVDGTGFGPLTFGLASEPSYTLETAFDAKYDLATGACLSVTADAARLMDVPRRKAEFVVGQGFVESGAFDLALPLQGSSFDLLGTGGTGVGASADAYLAEYERVSGALALEWAVACGGPGGDRANAVCILPAEAACVVVGTYREQAQFRTTSGSAVTRTAAGDNDIFVARYRLEDDDGDGLSNLQETALGSSSTASDTDGDGFWDVLEVLEATLPTSSTSVPASLDGSFTALGVALTLDANGGIKDADELALLCALLAPSAPSCGIHAGVSAAFATNVARMYVDTAAKVTPNAQRMLLAAYLTLGDAGSVTAVQSALSTYSVTIDTANYDLSRAGFLARTGDADGDGVSNQQEYTNAGSARAAYLTQALDASNGGDVLLFQNGENGIGWCWGTSTWDLVTDPAGVYGKSWHCGATGTNFSSPTVSTTGYTSLQLTYKYRDHGIDADDLVYLEFQTSVGGTLIWELHATMNEPPSSEDTWVTKTMTLTDASYFHSAFRVRFAGSSIDSGEDLWIDELVVRGF